MIKTANRIAKVEEYYFSRKLAEVRALDTPEWKVINLGIGSPDLAPSETAIEALITSARNPAKRRPLPLEDVQTVSSCASASAA